MRILVVEDDKEALKFVTQGLSEAGYTVDSASDGMDGLFLATEHSYDLIILDRMLPKIDGLTVITTLRSTGKTTPILILSALSQVDERVKGLKGGADDYLVKPFAFSELMARVEALTRRKTAITEKPILRVHDLEMNLLTRTVMRSGKEIPLQNREFKLLEYMMRHAGQVVTRTMLLENVWDFHFDPQTNVIDVQVSRLRQKIDKGFTASLIHTIRGAGYKLGSE
jgi:two-component system OmpR family response regulator